METGICNDAENKELNRIINCIRGIADDVLCSASCDRPVMRTDTYQSLYIVELKAYSAV